MDYISRKELYEDAVLWEEQAFHMVEKTRNDEDKTQWKIWSAILKERSAFKFDIADAPHADVIERIRGKWIKSNIPNEKYVCSECGGACWYYDYQGEVTKSNFCPNCGADMLEAGK